MMLFLLALGLLGLLDTDVRLKPDTTVAVAITRAVVDRMGDVQVVVRLVSTAVSDRADLVAAIEPGSRLGQPIRFILSADGKRVGSAVAKIDVVGSAPRARRSFARDEEIAAGDIDMASAAITNVVLRRMPSAADIAGARARRDIVAGELLTHAVVALPPAVRSGDEVQVVVTVGPVQVSSVGRASGSGRIGDRVRVTTSSSRKPLNARIVGRGAVEIVR